MQSFDAIYGFNKYLEKGDFWEFGRDAYSNDGSIFTARTDASHREHRRKVVGPALSSSKVATYEPTISKNVLILLSRVTAALSVQGNVSSINVVPSLHRYTFDTILEIIYGEPLCSEPYTATRGASSTLAGFRAVSKFAWCGALLPWLGRIMRTRALVYLSRRPTYDAEGQLTGLASLAARGRDLVLNHPELARKSTEPSILKNYLEVPNGDSKQMTPDEMWRECFNLTFAGPGSTGAALTATLYELGTPQGHDWQDRILADLGTAEPAPTSSSILTAVIKETLRLRAPFPTAFPRSIAAGAELAIPDISASLPIDTTVSANTYVLGHSKEIWGLDAEVWKPERWLVDEGDRKKLDEKFVAFSKGSRGCIGREIALAMLTKAVAGVILKWDVRQEGDLKGKSFLEMQYSECNVSFTERRQKH